MGKIIYLMGKSATGKDTIFRELRNQKEHPMNTIVPYTTRPIREGEKNGSEYFFTDEAGFLALKEQGKVVEDRAYETFHGLWRYFTVDDGRIDLEKGDTITIGTLEAYRKMKQYFGKEKLVPIYIELDDGERLTRALNREKKNDKPKYEEMCRRFLADSVDYADIKIEEAGIERRFVNNNLQECLKEILSYLYP